MNPELRTRGFTLLEMLVVLVLIVGLGAGISAISRGLS